MLPKSHPTSKPNRAAAGARLCPDEVLDAGDAFHTVTADQICRTAAGMVSGERARSHGDWTRTFDRIAAVWSGFLGVPITGKQAALMMAQFKTVRADAGEYNPDDFADISGYGAGAGEIAAREHKARSGRTAAGTKESHG